MSNSNNGKNSKLRLQIVRSEVEDGPRGEGNLGTMVCAHRHYNLGDKAGLQAGIEVVREHSNIDFLDDYDLNCAEVLELLTKTNQAIILPLYLFDHSGLTMSTSPFSCPWDSGQVGFIFASKKKVREYFNWTRLSKARITEVENSLKSEVKTYDQYLTGDVWGFRAIEDDEEVDSCWGFYGENPLTNGMLEYLPKEFVPLAEAGTFEHVCT